MNKPDDIPKDVWFNADVIASNIRGIRQVEAIARAIMAAKADELDAKDAIIAELVEALTKIADATDSDSLLKLLYRTRSALSKASQD